MPSLECQAPVNSTSDMFLRRNVSFSVAEKFIISFICTVFVAFATHIAFLNNIASFDSDFQESYITDGYYYIHLGEQATRLTGSALSSLSDAVESLRPNVSSYGIVYLSALLAYVYPSRTALPVFFIITYFAIFYVMLANGYSWSGLLFLPYTGLLPNLFIPTKESFFLIGFLLLLLAQFGRKYWLSALAGVLLMYLARSDGLILLATATAIWLFRKNKLLLLSLMGVAVAGYIIFARDLMFSLATAFQLSADDVGTGFCNVGPLSICLDSLGSAEFIYVQRVLTLLLFPIKWVIDFCKMFGDMEINATGIIIRSCLLLHIAWCASAISFAIKKNGDFGQIKSWMLIFLAVYCSSYGALLYFQATRQVVLATSMVAIGLGFSGIKRSQQCQVLPRPV
jgi:hypothetical protein